MKTLMVVATLALAFLPLLAWGDADLAVIGKQVFFDVSLSTPAGQGCVSCHSPHAGFAHPDHSLPVSRGVLPDRVGSRNAPSVAYAAFSPLLHYDPILRPGIMEAMYVGGFFWDGRAKSLEDQVKEPFLNPLEMHNPDKAAVVASLRKATYAAALEAACGAGSLERVEAAYECMAKTLAAYLRSPEVSPFTSKFDAWQAGNASLAAAERRGFDLFTGKAKCTNCHSMDGGPTGKALFTNFGYQNTGAPRNTDLPYYGLPRELNPSRAEFVDRGLGDAMRRAGVAEAEAAKEDGKFKIPSLRNVAVTAPYMHNGVFKTLREVVEFDNTRDVVNGPAPEVPENIHRHVALRDGHPGAAASHGIHPHPPAEGTFGRLGLSDQEVDDIVAFLTTLTDGYKP